MVTTRKITFDQLMVGQWFTIPSEISNNPGQPVIVREKISRKGTRNTKVITDTRSIMTDNIATIYSTIAAKEEVRPITKGLH